MYIQMLNGLYAVQWLSYLHLLHIIIILHFIGYMNHAEYKFRHFERYWADS